MNLALTDKSLKQFRYSPKFSGAASGTIKSKGQLRTYYYYVPNSVAKKPRIPFLLALHGAGRTGLSMIDTWHKIADKYGFVIVAPNGINKNWSIKNNELQFFKKVVADVELKSEHIHSHIYIFGHSNGAAKAIWEGANNQAYFDRVAVHGGTLPKKVGSGVKNKPTSMKVGLFIGDSDHIFSIDSARQTSRWLTSIGVQSDIYILENHTHWYYQDANRINSSIWAYLTRQ